jgi:hypothetical protein
MGEAMAAGAHVECVEIGDGDRCGDIGLRDAVLPGEAVFVPQRPDETEQQSGGGKHVAEAAPEELAGIGQAAVEADDGEAAELHAGSGAGEHGEKRHVEAIEKIGGDGINGYVGLGNSDFAAERTEKAEESGASESQEDGVERAGPAAFGERSHGDEGGLRMGAVVRRGGEVELGLDADFHALGVALAQRQARAGLGFGLRGCGFMVIIGARVGLAKRQAGLRIIVAEAAAADAILLEAARDFAAPVGLGGSGACGTGGVRRASRFSRVFRGRTRAGGDGLEEVVILGSFAGAERARIRVVEQQSATLRADAYHWSVLRCGSSSDGTGEL